MPFAAQNGYSNYYVTRKFKKELGITMHEYVLLQRIERAKALYVDLQSSITDVSERLGFSSPNCFCDLFKKPVGITPGVFRNQGSHSSG